MFRNTQLLRRSKQVSGTGANEDLRPLAVLADPYEVEASMILPILEKHGFRVLEARDGSTALQFTLHNQVSLVVASLDMPQLSGTQLCQKVRETNGHVIPFVFISPQGAVPDKFAGFETFANDYAQRPLNLEEFELRLNAVLRARQAAPPLAQEAPPPSRPPERVQPPSTIRIIPVRHSAAPSEMVHDSSLEVAPVESDTIDALLNSRHLEENSVRPQEAALYKEAFEFLKVCVGQLMKGESISILVAQDIANRMVKSVLEHKGLAMLATDRTPAYSFQQHSLNMAVIATRIGETMKLPEDRLARICLAGLVHDMGSVKLPQNLIGKYGGFTPLERVEMQRRPLYSEQLLTGYQGFDWLPRVVGQVYERENGKGYPRGLKGRDICQEAKILGVADTFEACTHRRAQRPAMTGYEAIEIMTSEVDNYSETTTKAMIRSFSVYPLNEFVVLNTGEIGRVIDINPDNPLRPIVRLLYSVQGEELMSARTIDLAQNSQLWITSAITPDELPQRPR
jgi:HD-GYP domain-containing protein (c-di-GMP phosphodiesterase class II)/CheY-like chemotaxis protein